MILIDGKHTADIIKKEIAAEVAAMVAAGERPPHLRPDLVAKAAAARPMWPIRSRPARCVASRAACSVSMMT